MTSLKPDCRNLDHAIVPDRFDVEVGFNRLTKSVRVEMHAANSSFRPAFEVDCPEDLMQKVLDDLDDWAQLDLGMLPTPWARVGLRYQSTYAYRPVVTGSD